MGSVCYVVSIVPRQKMVRASANKLKQDETIEEADISTRATGIAVCFKVPPTDAHSRRLVPDDQSQPASEGLARKRRDSLAQRCWLVRKLWLRFRLNFDELTSFRSTLYGRPSIDQDQPESSLQSFAYPHFLLLTVVASSARSPPEHPLSPDAH